jgi:hypothetical protein
MKYKSNRSRKALTLQELKLRMTDAIKVMEEIIFTADGEQKKIQAVNAMSGMIGKYTKLVEVVDLEARLSTLEEQMKNDSFKKN